MMRPRWRGSDGLRLVTEVGSTLRIAPSVDMLVSPPKGLSPTVIS